VLTSEFLAYLNFVDFQRVEVMSLFFEKFIAEFVQITPILFQVDLEFMDVFPRLLKELINNRDGWGIEPEAELDWVCRDEAASARWDSVA